MKSLEDFENPRKYLDYLEITVAAMVLPALIQRKRADLTEENHKEFAEAALDIGATFADEVETTLRVQAIVLDEIDNNGVENLFINRKEDET